MSEIGERLQVTRRLSDASAAEVGLLAGLSKSIVGMIESGARPDPSGSTIAAIAPVLGTTTDFLLTGKGKPPSKRAVQTAVDAARARVAPPATGTEGR